jgi:excisionase family DNA binding protein
MEQRLYSVEEIAGFLDLHPKTVRRFIREGKIKARKIGRAWKIHQDDLREYAHGELANGYEEPGFGPDTKLHDRISVSAVIEIHEGSQDEASRISNSLIAVFNCKDPSWGKSRYDFIYYPETKKARFILYGSPRFLSDILKAFEAFAKGTSEETCSKP